MLRRIILNAILIASSSSVIAAVAFPPEIRLLVKARDDADGICRGSSNPDAPATIAACDRRDKIDEQARTKGWCFDDPLGGGGRATFRWHKCKPETIQQQRREQYQQLKQIDALTRPQLRVERSKPSFDCAKAVSSVDKMVCSDVHLAELDRQMTGLWKKVFQHAANCSACKANTLAEQRAWVRKKNSCSIYTCLESAYNERISELTGVLDAESQD